MSSTNGQSPTIDGFENSQEPLVPETEDLMSRQRALVLLSNFHISFQSVQLGLFSSLLVVLLYNFVPDFYAKPNEGHELAVWDLVWLAIQILECFNGLIILYFRRNHGRTPFPFVTVHRALSIFELAWFLYGTKLLWFTQLQESKRVVTWALLFWWLQATAFIIPCAFVCLLMAFLPCLILLLVYLQVPREDQRPTPETVLSRLEVKTYADLIFQLEQQRNRREEVQSGNCSPRPVPPPQQSSLATSAVLENLLRPLQTDVATPLRPFADRLEVNTSCPICMLDFSDSDFVMIMPCDQRHFFHQACVKQWLQNSQVCPICRSNVVRLTMIENGTPPDDTHSQ